MLNGADIFPSDPSGSRRMKQQDWACISLDQFSVSRPLDPRML